MSAEVTGSLAINVAGESVTLRADRSMLWRDSLFVADVHIGKAEIFRGRGMPVPSGDLHRDLERLSWAMGESGARRLVVLGDLIHGPIPADVRAAVGEWRARQEFSALLVAGNHDRHDVLPPEWRFERVAELREGPFLFRHEPAEGEGYVWGGHLHPGVTLRGRGDALRVPCFHIGARVGILPAFGSFTGHGHVPTIDGDRRFAIVGAGLVEVGRRSSAR